MNSVTIHWQKVITLKEFDDHIDFLKLKKGLYLWIIGGQTDQQPRRICYIGETNNNFAARHSEHFQKLLGGSYLIPKIKPNEDLSDLFINHWHGKSVEDFHKEDTFSFPLINKLETEDSTFHRAFVKKDEIDARYEMINQMSYAFGTVEKLPEGVNFKQIEAALIMGMRAFYQYQSSHKKPLHMRHTKKRRNRTDLPIGAISQYPKQSLTIIHDPHPDIAKLIPQELLNIIRYKP